MLHLVSITATDWLTSPVRNDYRITGNLCCYGSMSMSREGKIFSSPTKRSQCLIGYGNIKLGREIISKFNVRWDGHEKKTVVQSSMYLMHKHILVEFAYDL